MISKDNEFPQARVIILIQSYECDPGETWYTAARRGPYPGTIIEVRHGRTPEEAVGKLVIQMGDRFEIDIQWDEPTHKEKSTLRSPGWMGDIGGPGCDPYMP
jgi:hypothetical protein